MIKIINTVILVSFAFNSFADEKQACAGIAHSLGLHKEAKVYLDSATKEVENYYQAKGLPDNEINLLVADIVYSPISDIKRMATMLRLSDKNAANMQYIHRCSSIYKSIIANDGKSNIFAATQGRVEYEKSDEYKQEQKKKDLALALVKERQEQQQALKKNKAKENKAKHTKENQKSQWISTISYCQKILESNPNSWSCKKYDPIINSGNYKKLSYEELKPKIELADNTKQKFTVSKKSGMSEIRAKENLVRGIDACKSLIKSGFQNESCAKYKEVIKAGDYNELSYNELVNKTK